MFSQAIHWALQNTVSQDRISTACHMLLRSALGFLERLKGLTFLFRQLLYCYDIKYNLQTDDCQICVINAELFPRHSIFLFQKSLEFLVLHPKISTDQFCIFPQKGKAIYKMINKEQNSKTLVSSPLCYCFLITVIIIPVFSHSTIFCQHKFAHLFCVINTIILRLFNDIDFLCVIL